MYVELRAASAFSFLEAASAPEALAERAMELGYPALALVDRDGLYGAARFHLAATRDLKPGIRAIIGAELTIRLDDPRGDPRGGARGEASGTAAHAEHAAQAHAGAGAGAGKGGRRARQLTAAAAAAHDATIAAAASAASAASASGGFGSTAFGSTGSASSRAARAAAAADAAARRASRVEPITWRLPVLVESREGYRNLCRLITKMKLSAPKGEGALTLADLDGASGGLIAFAGRPILGAARHAQAAVLSSASTAATAAAHAAGYADAHAYAHALASTTAPALFDRLTGLFGRDRLFVELQRHFLRDQEADNHALRALASMHRLPLVATNGVRFATPEERPLYDVLACILHKTTLARAGRRLARNAECYLKSPAEMARLFADLPAAVTATRELSDRLAFTLADLGYEFPDYPLPAGESKDSYLRRITERGAIERFGSADDALRARARAQIDRELALIAKLGLAGYFLIVWDIVTYCRANDILVQGRGSAANSAVCYCLGITSIDPIRMELLFERFLTEARGEWPDIDLDLPSGDKREQVIQHVYQKYGPLGAGMTANVITYRGKSAAREVGKTMDLDPAQIDRLAKIMHGFEWRDPQDTIIRNLRDAGLNPDDVTLRQFATLWKAIQSLPRHLGQHSGGMIVCHGRLDEIVPLEPASMPGRVVVQWDKDDCADMGIIKVDLLGLGMMAVLHETMTIINTGELRPVPPTLSGRPMPPRGMTATDPALPPRAAPILHAPPLTLAKICLGDDPYVYEMLRRGDTVGVFQIESRAQMATLPRMRPERFYDLVVEVAIVRPGPIVGQMMHPYLKRRAGREDVTCFHPSLEPILRRTLGVPLFQEQLLRMAMTAAGFSGGEAEELRRALGFRRSESRMKKVEEKLREGMAAQGIAEPAVSQIITSITAFALYGFPESHAASFALLAYASAYLRAYYPGAFYAAMLNNQPMGFYHPATLIKDAQRHGVRFRSIDVQVSDWECRVERDGRTVRLGLLYVQGLRRDVGQRIAPGRADAGGAYASLEQLIASTGLRREEMATLAEIGALNAFGYDRRGALWQIERAVRPRGTLLEREDAEMTTDVASDAKSSTGGADGELTIERAAAARAAFEQAEQAISHAQQGSAAEQAVPHAREGGAAEQAVLHAQQEGAAAGDGERASPSPLAPLGEIRQGGEGGRGGVGDSGRSSSPLAPMTPIERIMADYEGTGFTIGPHPMAYRRAEMEARGVRRATALAGLRDGCRVRVAGAVITRQRPGTAKGFVFLTLEDETGIANIIVQPPVFDEFRITIVESPFLLIEGVLQQQDGVTSVRAESLQALGALGPAAPSHDFH